MCKENLECLFFKKLQKMINKHFMKPNYNVFHYTNHVHLIMRAHNLKLQSHQKLNTGENEELACGISLIREKMSKSHQFQGIIQRFNEFINQGLEVYTCSFCGMKRSRYAFKKYGKSNICFRRSFFLNLKKDTLKLGIPCLYGKVIYKANRQKEIINSLFECYEKYSRKCNLPDVSFFTVITLILPLLKPYRHNQDKESRLISMQIKRRNGELITVPALIKANFTFRDIKQITFSFTQKSLITF